MTTYVFIIRKTDLDSPSGNAKKQFEKGLRRKFPSFEFMQGYVAGYGVGEVEIYTVAEFEKKHNVSNLTHHYYSYFVACGD